LTGNASRALQLIGKHIGDAVDGSDPNREFHFFSYSWLAIDAISRVRKRAKLRLPNLDDLFAGEREYVLGDLATGLAERGLDLAARFDRRNGNDYYTRQWRHMKKWQRYAPKAR